MFHKFTLGDVEDPDLYATQPIYEWQQTEAGQWVMTHCKDPQYSIGPDKISWGHQVRIYGILEDRDATFWQLKWGKQ